MNESSPFEAKLPSQVKVVALAGRNGSGKSTVLLELNKRLATEKHQIVKEPQFSGHVLDFCCFLLWNNNSEYEKRLFKTVILSYFPDLDFGEKILKQLYRVEYDFPLLDLSSNLFEVNFSQSLKRIAAQIFSVPYAIFAGETEETRKQRETEILPFLFDKRRLTYRQCLEFLGTEVFRSFADDIWIRSWYYRVQRLIRSKRSLSFGKITPVYIGVADLRFENEFHFLSLLNAQCFCVYRQSSDLVLTIEDQKTHPSRWHFLKFRNGLQPLENSSSREDLGKRLAYYLFGESLPQDVQLAKLAGWIGIRNDGILFHEFTAAKVNQQWQNFLNFYPSAFRDNFSVILLPRTSS